MDPSVTGNTPAIGMHVVVRLESYPLHRRDSCDDPVHCGDLTTSRFFSLISIFATSQLRHDSPVHHANRHPLISDVNYLVTQQADIGLTTYSPSVQQSRLPLGHLPDWLPDSGHGPFPVSTTTLTASACFDGVGTLAILHPHRPFPACSQVPGLLVQAKKGSKLS